MFDAIKAQLDEISLAIYLCREGEDVLTVGFGRSIGPDFPFCYGLADGIGVVSFVRKQRVAFFDASHEAFSLRAVGTWSPVRQRLIGRPFASTIAWILLVGPPRKGLMQPSPASPFPRGSALVNTNTVAFEH